MSMKNSTRLLLKATPELLEGWCGPVVVEWHNGHRETKPLMTADDWRGPGVSALYLDLARAECRDRVTRVVGAKLGVLDPVWVFRSLEMLVHAWFVPRRSFWAGVPDVGDSYKDAVSITGRRRVRGCLQVPALAALDPHDDTRLPDGSRLVDALALHAVATEVFGG